MVEESVAEPIVEPIPTSIVEITPETSVIESIEPNSPNFPELAKSRPFVQVPTSSDPISEFSKDISDTLFKDSRTNPEDFSTVSPEIEKLLRVLRR